MGYQQGLSGLSAASSDLDVIGNNIANANTTGFKSGAAQFADMYANSVATAVGNQVGIGTQALRSAAAVLAGHDHQHQPGARRRDQRQRLLPAVEQRLAGVLAQRRVPARQERQHHQRARPATDGLRREQLGRHQHRADRAAQRADREHRAASHHQDRRRFEPERAGSADARHAGRDAGRSARGSTLTTTGATITNTASGTNNDNYTVKFHQPRPLTR